ncbi:hypothetical protein [Oceanobacillus alkalisoli]|nr:hypothetical protein [Oceanobacillus alkalisoli]MCF3943121.1 hypothetical protein [Oceanobacillus alkalisoli]
MHIDIAVYKCMVDERLEKVKKETYGKKCYYEQARNAHLKMKLIMLNVFL